MPSYSRRQPMMSGDAPRITGLNSFGQPFRGNKIRGVGAEERRVGLAYSRELNRGTGPLSTRHQDGSQGNFAERKIAEAQVAAQAANERGAQEAVARGRTQAQAATGTATTPKRRGQLIETGPGRSKWVSGEEMDAMNKARVEARKKTEFVGPPAPRKPGTIQEGPSNWPRPSSDYAPDKRRMADDQSLDTPGWSGRLSAYWQR